MSIIPVSRPVLTKEMIDAASDALANERLVMGESVFRFEEEYARYIGTDHAVSVSSGTDALILAMIALNVRNRHIVTTPFSFIATATSVIHAGGIPAFADVSEHDYNLDPAAVQDRMTGSSAGVMPVDLYGYPARIDEIIDSVGKKEVKIIEDACQAHGATHRGSKCGCLGDVGCFSFYPTKNMTVGGDGGMITTNDDRLAEDARKLRDCGRLTRYEHDVFGFTSRLNTANAAFGRVQLRYLDGWNQRRRDIARRYADRLRDIAQITLPPMGTKETQPVFHLFAICCEGRDDLAKHLSDDGIDSAVHYPIPIHLQPVYRYNFGYSGGEFKVSEWLAEHMLSIPMFPEMTDRQVDLVSDRIVEHFA